MKKITSYLENPRAKKFFSIAVIVAVALWFVFRFVMVALESRMSVFNPIREIKQSGAIVETVVAQQSDGIINIPIDIKNNRAYVSGIYQNKLRAGQKVGTGVVVSVSSNLDLDTGMYVVRTRGVADGLHNVQVKLKGYFLPAYVVRDNVVLVLDSDVAVARDVKISGQDLETVCVSGGISDGDIVISSKVNAGQKVRVKK